VAGDITIGRLDSLSAELVDRLTRLVDDAEAADGVRPLSDHSLLHLRAGGVAGDRHLLADLGGDPIGYAHVDPAESGTGVAAELFVAPDARGRGAGPRLLDAVIAEAPGAPVQVWAHGRLPAAQRLAASFGMREERVLLRMVRDLGGNSPPLEPARWADGVTVRTFEVGRDEPAWLRVNARAFADLPDQGGWRREDLDQREQAEWFDPAGFFLAERAGELLGFHWTKVHAHGGGADRRRPIGEVYVIGVDPAAQGLGLGKALLLHGLHHLRQAGLQQAMLYVDGGNATAVALYERFAFTTATVDVSYAIG
jgi:mycothiol synthase